MSTIRVAAVQWAPVVHDASEGAKKAARAIAEASTAGARFIVFPETWLQGYPYFTGLASASPEYQEYLGAYSRAAVAIGGAEMAVVREAANQAKATVCMGLGERSGGTIYNTQAFIGANGALLGAHRKLMPTLNERMVWGMGDGSDLDAYDTPVGKIGGLICFEHQMALARFALCGLGIQIHAAQWPGYGFLTPLIDACTRQLAFENGCFVISAREVMDHSQIAPLMPSRASDPSFYQMGGGSAIIGPDGAYLAEPVFGKETIVYADVELAAIARTKTWFDGAGHYARPDVFQLRWDRRPKPPMDIVS